MLPRTHRAQTRARRPPAAAAAATFVTLCTLATGPALATGTAGTPTGAGRRTAAAPRAAPAARQTEPWLARVRASAMALARAPLAGEPLAAARLEVQRARLGMLPSLRLSEDGRLGVGGDLRVGVEAGVALPLVAPSVGADVRLAELRLAVTERQLAQERRIALHDRLAQAAALQAAVRGLDVLANLDTALHTAQDRGQDRGQEAAPEAGAGPRPPTAPTAPARSPSDGAAAIADLRDRTRAQLLLAGRSDLRREAQRLRTELETGLALRLPPLERLAVPSPATEAAARRPPPAPLGYAAADLDPERCLGISDTVALAALGVRERAASEALRAARSATRVDLEASGRVALGTDAAETGSSVRLSVRVRLPRWRPATGAATLSLGSAGLQQQASLGWPNAAPAPPPQRASGAAEVAAARDEVRRQLGRLRAQELGLLRSRAVLDGALATLAGARPAWSLARAYLEADLELERIDAEQALAVTALDAALLCGVLPP